MLLIYVFLRKQMKPLLIPLASEREWTFSQILVFTIAAVYSTGYGSATISGHPHNWL